MSQQEKEKVKIALDASLIPKSEVEDLISAKEDLWQTSGEGFSQATFDGIKWVAPSFFAIINEFLNKEENQNKKVSFTLENFQFGVSLRGGFKFLWRRSMGSGRAGGSSTGGFKQTWPLEEIFAGTVDACNEKMAREPNKRWYKDGETQFIQNPNITDPGDPNFVGAFASIKRNKMPPPEAQAAT